MRMWVILFGLLIAGLGIWQLRNLEAAIKLTLVLRAINLREFDLADHPRLVKRGRWESRLTILLGAILIVGGILDLAALAGVLFFLLGFIGFVVIIVETA